ncbi:hypothetical protein MUO14_13925 [Halobacillus shinanisalinarum]|uniref:Spore germination protein n=1 Tax=Halobacillus shinanisalinarum TaxID=2932258 RepID=A0ABY4GUS7_9BACI|nr:hypothetical protein [Halobacillus shinanisalinarum]UOQ91650.1 hypothetical protein MUO14_13925 [Halobacillus shinanisalinarum]
MHYKQLEAILWSIAFPGFGQFLNRDLIKGLTFLVLEIVINLCSSFNRAIIFSFNGEITKAIEVTNYQWLMFYPCVYMFGIWDAYKYSHPDVKPLAFLPFVISAYFVTVGLIYSSKIKIMGMILGPVWMPIIFLLPGLVIGFLLRKIILVRTHQ